MQWVTLHTHLGLLFFGRCSSLSVHAPPYIVYSAEDDAFDVYREVVGLSARWSSICLALRLRPSDRSKIAVAHPGNPDECLEAVVVKWLQKGYNYQQHGSPSWKMLVKAVGDPAGGNDCALAGAIAKKYPGMKYKIFIANKDGFSVRILSGV